MADSFNDTPAEGDGFTYEHFSSKQVRPAGDTSFCIAGNSAAGNMHCSIMPAIYVPFDDMNKRNVTQF
jgi:hypothetical protein